MSFSSVKFWKSNICYVKCWKCFTELDQIQQDWHHATVGQSILLPCSPTEPHIWIEGDRQWAWTSCLWFWGKYSWLRSTGCRPKRRSSKSGVAGNNPVSVELQSVSLDNLPFQFTICSSATSDALTTYIFFFQLLRQSGNPWISFYMEPTPGKVENIFKLTVIWHFFKPLP